jgi:hypothetical protein
VRQREEGGAGEVERGGDARGRQEAQREAQRWRARGFFRVAGRVRSGGGKVAGGVAVVLQDTAMEKLRIVILGFGTW